MSREFDKNRMEINNEKVRRIIDINIDVEYQTQIDHLFVESVHLSSLLREVDQMIGDSFSMMSDFDRSLVVCKLQDSRKAIEYINKGMNELATKTSVWLHNHCVQRPTAASHTALAEARKAMNNGKIK